MTGCTHVVAWVISPAHGYEAVLIKCMQSALVWRRYTHVSAGDSPCGAQLAADGAAKRQARGRADRSVGRWVALRRYIMTTLATHTPE